MFRPAALRSRFTKSLRGLAALTMALQLTGAGCDDDPGPLRPSRVGSPDNPSNGTIRVDEGGIVGQAKPGVLAAQIPVTNLTGDEVRGKLRLLIASVDGAAILGQRDIPYELGPNQTLALAAELALPADVTEPADWVKYNLEVESEGDLRVTRSLLAVVPALDVRLEGPATVARNRKVSYRVRVEDPLVHRARIKVPVELQIKKGQEVVQRFSASTGDRGDALFEITLPETGDFEVHAQTVAEVAQSITRGMAKVESPGARVLLTTDKPIYQPGQTIHLRALALSRGQNLAITGQPVVFEIADGKGNKIHRRELTSDSHGIAAGTFKLGRFVNMGDFKITAAVGGATTQKTVQVSRYVLPKFRVSVKADRPYYLPGETITGSINVQYFFGKAVAGADVDIEAVALDVGETAFARVMGKTNGSGVFSYSLQLPRSLVGLPLDMGNALVNLRVKVSDTAGQEVVQESPITVAPASLRVAIVPEGHLLVPGLANTLDVFVTDPTGAPVANASVQVKVPAKGSVQAMSWQLTTDVFGQAQMSYIPGTAEGAVQLDYSATMAGGASAEGQIKLGTQAGGQHLLVRTDRAVYAVGDSVKVNVLGTTPSGDVYVNIINRGQIVDMRTLALLDGGAQFDYPITPDLLGDSRIEAYVVDERGNMVKAGRTVFARGSGGLTVELTTDKPQYAPGTPAQLTFTVKDENGAPTAAALGVQVVDEAVFSVIDARPGLLRTFFELEESFAKPSYQLRPPAVDLNKLLFEETAGADSASVQAAQRRATATFAALGDTGVMGIQAGSWEAVFPAIKLRLMAPLEAERAILRATVSQLVKDSLARLEKEGCSVGTYYCDKRNKSLLEAVKEDLAASLKATDFWGNLYANKTDGTGRVIVLASRGPDEREGSKDDFEIAFASEDLDATIILGPGAADGGVILLPDFDDELASDDGAPLPGNAPNTGGSSGSNAGNETPGDSPRVRREFPETLYVNPALIAGGDGKATVTVDMADSITQWRVSSLAHSPGGKLGGGVAGVTVFQEFFVDVNFPATLTRGDEVAFPVAVYNYLETPQTVTVTLTPDDWYTPLGATTQEVALGAGEVKGVRFPVRVDEVGRQTLTVTGFGSARSDAVARSVLVEPNGEAVPVARSGSLGSGEVAHSVTFPAEAVPGSQKLYVNVYPAFLSSVVEGMDSMLQVPSGCFEQTTATAWPNVLVTDYLKKTGQITPAIALKAESLMSAGYQRLLTFEHPGGGFSWFGTQDPKPYLSVTAFGLMEFSDMAKVHNVDMAMLTRTRDWMLAQQASDGSWQGDMSEFFSFHTSQVRNTAFVVWALASSSYSGDALSRGLAYVKQNMDMKAADAYTLGILANAFVAAAPNDPVTATLLGKLEEKKTADGDMFTWDSGGTQTNFYGGGDDAKITTTALAAHALIAANGAKTTIDGALKFLTAKRDTLGNFGSTQATIWTLRTLLLAASKGTDGAVGTVAITADGKPVRTLMLTPEEFDVMTTVDLGEVAGVLAAGEHEVKLTFTGTGKLSYNVVSSHHVPWKAGPPPAGPLSITVDYDKTKLALDETVTAKVSVRNNTRSQQDMVLLTLGLPPGFAVVTEDLEALRTAKKISMYEMTGKQLILYVTQLAAASTLPLEYRLQATMPVRADDGGAVVALYYEPAQRATVKGKVLEVIAPQ